MIGFFIDTFYPMIDGVVTVVDNYARILSKYADVIVFAPSITGKEKDDIFPYKVVRAKSIPIPKKDYSLPIPKLDSNFLKEVEKIDLDIVHIHSPMMMGKVGVEYAKKHHKILIGTIHSQYKQDFYRNTKSKIMSNMLTNHIMNLYNECDECYTVGEGMAKIIHQDYHFSKELKIMRNATTMKLLEDKTLIKKRMDKKYQIKEGEYVFLFVGRINRLKNIFFLLDALKELENKIPYKMLFVGNGEDEEAFKKSIKKHNLEKQVLLCGRIEDKNLLREYYARSDLFLFPSLYDTSSIVQVEAASQKCPTIFLKDSVTASGIIDNGNGFLAENDPKKYASRILEILNDQEIYAKVREGCYEKLYRTWGSEVEKVYENYLRLLEGEK